ncbi:MAG: biotin--[acetyl-CoA-carboxylase] ligase [Candidatus Rifleibacteriota bacterium]
MTENELVEKIKNIDFFKKHEFKHVKETGSTNDELKSALEHGFVRRILMTDFQMNGRGQYQRKWIAEPQTSLLFSFSSPFETTEFPLSLRTGLAVLSAVNKLKNNEDFWLKWPNDIFYSESKVGGILVESQVAKKQMNAVIGIGINLKKPGEMPEKTSSLQQAGIEVSASQLLLKILEEFSRLIQISDERAADLWTKKAGRFWQKSFILATSSHNRQKVRPLGLNPDGSLVISIGNGRKQAIKNGSLTLIKKNQAPASF